MGSHKAERAKRKFGVCGKQSFETEHEANAKAYYVTLTQPDRFNKMRVYRCGDCRAYHLTSRWIPG